MSRMGIIAEYIHFLRTQRKLWLLPLLAVLLLFGGIAGVGQGSAVLPFIYALF